MLVYAGFQESEREKKGERERQRERGGGEWGERKREREREREIGPVDLRQKLNLVLYLAKITQEFIRTVKL